MLPQDCWYGGVNLGCTVWVSNPDIKEGILASAPKTSSPDIKASFGACVGATEGENLRSYWLEMGFDFNIRTCFGEQGCLEIPYCIMSDIDEPSSFAVHCMSYIESATTDTKGWKIF